MNIQEQVQEGITKALSALGLKPNADLKAKVDSLTQDLATANERITTLNQDLEVRNTELADLKAKATQLTEDAKEHKAQLEAKEQEVEERANNLAASKLKAAGVDPVPDDVEADAPAGSNAKELWAQYHKLTDPKAQRAFWEKHRDVMSAD